MATQSTRFLTASGARSPRKRQQIQGLTAGQGAGCSKSTCGCGAMGGPFLVKSLWSKLWSCAKRGCRNPGREALKLFGAGMCRPGKRGLPLRNKCSWYRISYTISYPISYTIFNTLSSISNTRMTYDIGYDKLQLELRYRSFFIPIS